MRSDSRDLIFSAKGQAAIVDHIVTPSLADAPLLAPQYRLLSFEDTGSVLRMMLECHVQPVECPHCRSASIGSWGIKELTFLDLPRRGKPVEVVVEAKRYKCKFVDCKKTFMQELPAMASHRMMTQRLVRWVGEKAVSSTFVSIAAEIGVNEKTVRAVFSDFMCDMRKMVRMNAGPSMAILPAVILNSPRYVVLNTSAGMITDLVEDPNKVDLTASLQALGRAESVERVAIGFDELALDVVQANLPGALAFVDPLHILGLLNQGVRAARDHVRESLSTYERRSLQGDLEILMVPSTSLGDEQRQRLLQWLDRFPDLAEAHRFQDAIMELYGPLGACDTDEGQARIEAALMRLSPVGLDRFNTFAVQWSRWRQQMLNAFKPTPHTRFVWGLTDPAELAHLVESFGREYSFAAVRAKLLYPTGIPAFSLSSPGMGIDRLRRLVAGAD